MEEKNTVKMMVFRIKKMSKDGITRLSARTRLNYKKEIYKPLGKLEINPDRVYDEKTLAKKLLLEFGQGKYSGHMWNLKTHRLTKQAFKVLITGNIEESYNFEFQHTRGIARYGFWVAES